MKLIVLSDIHLMTPETAHLDQGNHARLEAAIDRINSAYADADLVVIAGDLADRGKLRAPYEDLKTALTRLTPPFALTLGNHDAREIFVDVFGSDPFCDANGFVQSAHLIDGTYVIVLDSVSDEPAPAGYRGARSPAGQLCDKRLAWLDARLREAQGHPVIVILHHPPLQLQISTDVMALQQPEALISRLKAHGDVRQVISGHIHMTTTALHSGMPFTTLAGGHTTSVEEVGTKANKSRRSGPAQMAVILSDDVQTTVHFDNYSDAHPGIASTSTT